MDPTPLTLLEQLKSGDNLAWEKFYDVYGRRIWAKVNDTLGRVRPKEDWRQDDHQFAGDICQDIIVKVFLSLPQFNRVRSGSFRLWLDIISRNHTVATLRKAQNRPVTWSQEKVSFLINQLGDSRQDFHVFDEQEYNRHVIGKALDWLKGEFPEETIQVFLRLQTEQASPQEIAAELGTTVQAVYLLKHRVVKKLREYMDQYLRDLLD